MKVSKNIRYLVRIRDYETIHIEVGAEADHHDLGWSDEDWSQIQENRGSWIDQLELLVITEVEKLAREEMARIVQWSEIEPNLAEDFLSSAPLSPVPPHARSQHGTAKKAGSTATSRSPTLIPERRGMPRVARGLPLSAEKAVRELETVLMRIPNQATP